MTPERSRHDERICIALAAAVVLAAHLIVRVSICDDAYITMKTAQNLALGHGLSFNPGERLYVSTTPLWSLLIAAVRTTGVDTVLATRLLGGAAEVLLAAGMVRLGAVAMGSPRIGLAAAIVLETNPAFLLTSMSGMELPLYLAAIAWSLALTIGRRWTLALMTAAVAIWVRFDGVLLFLLVAGMHAWESIRAPARARALRQLAPALAIAAGYFAFGLLYFHDAVPVTVQRKMGVTPPLSSAWFAGAGLVACNFGLVATGLALSWYKTPTPLILAPVAVFVGARTVLRERRAQLLAPIAFALVYAGAYVASGREYAVNFPWYFMPPLVPVALLAAAGLARFEGILRAVSLAWAAVMLAGCVWAGQRLESRVVAHRERRYAASAIWLSRLLPPDAQIAANEIGTIGFFARADVRVLDLFGLLRSQEDRSLGAVDLVSKYRPEAVATKAEFDYRHDIDAALPGAYSWIDHRGLLIGLRRDVAPAILPHAGELDAIEDALDGTHEAAR
jgi:hypothetical protein